MARLGLKAAAFGWGLAEATLFFLVPDVLLSAAGLTDLRRGLVCCLYALAGALAGGMAMYLWGAGDPAAAAAVVARVPAISADMLAQVQAQLAHAGLYAILFGPTQGIPYKTYAIQAAAAGIGPIAFLLISIPARLIRFAAVTGVIHALARVLPGTTRHHAWLLGTGWVGFYLWYFWIMLSP